MPEERNSAVQSTPQATEKAHVLYHIAHQVFSISSLAILVRRQPDVTLR